MIWDGLKAHRSHLARDYLDSLGGHIQIAFLPLYCPDLHPEEYLWATLKRHALANYCPDNLSELHTTAPNKLKSVPRSLLLAGCKPRSGDVMIYETLNRTIPHAAPQRRECRSIRVAISRSKRFTLVSPKSSTWLRL